MSKNNNLPSQPKHFSHWFHPKTLACFEWRDGNEGETSTLFEYLKKKLLEGMHITLPPPFMPEI